MPAYLLTWTTYATWLPGDERGWVGDDDKGWRGLHKPSKALAEHHAHRLRYEPVVLSFEQRLVIERVIRAHAEHRQWRLHAINVRTNHVHVVCESSALPEKVMGEFKAWASRAMRARSPEIQKLWTRHGSTRWLNSESSFSAAIHYVHHQQ